MFLRWMARLTALLALLPAPGHAQTVSACGQVVSAGVLDGDLDCSSAATAVFVSSGGSLDLGGHTILGGMNHGIVCRGDCFIDGSGGSIEGAGGNGIVGSDDHRDTVTASDVEVSNSAFVGITAGNVIVTNGRFSGNGACAVYALRKAIVTDSSFFQNQVGVSADRSVEVRGSLFSANVWGVQAYRRLQVADSTIVDTENDGARSRRIILTNSDLQNSGTNCTGVAAHGTCADIASASKPRLEQVRCGSSVRLSRRDLIPTGETWDGCALE